MINDVRALSRGGALDAAAKCQVPVCLMHMQGEPGTMQRDPWYDDVVREVREFLDARIQAALDAGIREDRIIVDPGFGFGKNLDHNLTLLANLDRLSSAGRPVLAGLSRKSMIVRILGYEPESRTASSVALALFAANKGAAVVRVHDVEETVQAVTVWFAAGRPPAGV
jgi:dihydropteroate synthase